MIWRSGKGEPADSPDVGKKWQDIVQKLLLLDWHVTQMIEGRRFKQVLLSWEVQEQPASAASGFHSWRPGLLVRKMEIFTITKIICLFFLVACGETLDS